MKKVLYVFLGILGVLVVALLVAPLFISVDQFRPQVIAAAESSLRAKVEIGPLKLRLFPNFKISSASLKVTPRPESGFAEPVVHSESLSAQASLFSMLSSPSLTVKIESPSVTMVKKQQKTNLEAILPEPKSDATAATPPAAGGSALPSEELAKLPGWVRSRVEAASFSLAVEKAHIVYQDFDTKSKTDLSAVDFSLDDIGLNQNMKARFAAAVDFAGDGILAKGPVSAELDMVSKTNERQEILLELKGSKDLSGLELKMTNLFHKQAKIPFGASFSGTVQLGKVVNVNFSALSMEFGTLAIKGSLKASDATHPENALLEFALRSNALNLADLKSYIPMVGAYKLSGKADFSADIRGSLSNPNLDIKLSANDVQGSSPELATPIKNLQAVVLVGGNLKVPLVDIKKVSMKIGKNSDLAMRGTVKGIDAPDVNLMVESKIIDLDEIMGTPNQGTAAAPAKGAGGKADEAVSTLPLDESLAQMAPTIDESLKNPMLDKLTAKFQTKLAKVKFMGAEYLDAGLLVTVKNRQLLVSKTSLRAYKGVIALSASMKLVPVNTEFQLTTNLSSISVGDAVKAHAPNWAGALSGSAIGLFEVSGKGFTKALLKDNLRGTVRGEVKEGKTNLAVIQVVNQVLESIPKDLSSAISSKARDSSKNQFIAGDFETMKLDAQIVGRKVNLKTMDTVFRSNQGNLGKFRFDTSGFVTFDQDVDMVGTAYLSPDLVRVPQLKGKSGQIELPVKFGGKMYEPKVDIAYSVKRVGETAAKAIVKDEAKKAAAKLLPELEKKAPKALQKGIQDLKKLFK